MPLLGGSGDLRADKAGRVTVTLPPLSVAVYRSNSTMASSSVAPTVYPTSPSAGAVVGGRAEIGAAVPANTFAEVSFLYRPVGTSTWTPIGTDDNAPYRVFHDVSGMAKGTLLEYRMVAKDLSGRVSATSTYGVVGRAAGLRRRRWRRRRPRHPARRRLGARLATTARWAALPAERRDWQPACDQAQLALDAKDDIWKGTWTIPAGDYEYKAAINKSWDENYGAGGAPGGGNIAYKAPGGQVTFYYDHRTHWVTSSAQGPIITAPGSFQSELGCPGDWAPDCMRSWLQDPDGDGTYTFSTDQIPAGNYEFKVAVGLELGRVLPRQRRRVLGAVRRRRHDHHLQDLEPRGHRQDLQGRGLARPDQGQGLRRRTGPRGVAGLGPARGHRPGDAALAAALVGRRRPRGRRRGRHRRLRGHADPRPRGPAGLARRRSTPSSRARSPSGSTRRRRKQLTEILKGQVAVAMYDSTGRLLDATGAQTAIALDSLYAAKAASRSYGVSFSGGKVGFSLWAPTAQSVALLTWPAGSADQPASAARRVPMTRAADGSWSTRWPRPRTSATSTR